MKNNYIRQYFCKDNLVLSEGPTEGLDDTTILTEAKYSINFAEPRKRFVLSVYYNTNRSFLFVNAAKTLFRSKRFRNKTISLLFR